VAKPASSLLLVALASIYLLGPAIRAAETDTSEYGSWHLFSIYEQRALHDYKRASADSDVADNGRKLRELAGSPDFGALYANCGLAAQTLSHMVISNYITARASTVPEDWHRYAADYARQRRECLAELKLDEKDHRLPDWFGK
jgi:hypothetical protein